MITDVKTQIISAREGIITDEMKYVAKEEGVSPEFIREGVEKGTIVILKNNQRKDSIPVGVGEGLSVKINANIGTSNEKSGLENELKKVKIIEETGADVLMIKNRASLAIAVTTSIVILFPPFCFLLKANKRS